MLSTEKVMNLINMDKVVREDLSIAYTLSMPVLNFLDEQVKLTTAICTINFQNENEFKCVGYICRSYDDEGDVDVFVKTIIPSSVAENILTIIPKRNIIIRNKENYIKCRYEVYANLDIIKACVFKDPSLITSKEFKAIKDYLEILCSISSERLIGVYYSMSSVFFDWCCATLFKNR